MVRYQHSWFWSRLRANGERHPVAYASRQTSLAEKYALTELEVAALVSAFLVHLKGQTKGLLARWYLGLSKFLPQVTLQYKPGSSNMVADALSRAPVESEARVFQVQEEALTSKVTTSETLTTVLEQVQQEQRKGTELRKLIDFLTKQSLPEDPKEINVVLNTVKKGYYVVDDHRHIIVVPVHLRQRVLEEHHNSTFCSQENVPMN